MLLWRVANVLNASMLGLCIYGYTMPVHLALKLFSLRPSEFSKIKSSRLGAFYKASSSGQSYHHSQPSLHNLTGFEHVQLLLVDLIDLPGHKAALHQVAFQKI